MQMPRWLQRFFHAVPRTRERITELIWHPSKSPREEQDQNQEEGSRGDRETAYPYILTPATLLPVPSWCSGCRCHLGTVVIFLVFPSFLWCPLFTSHHTTLVTNSILRLLCCVQLPLRTFPLLRLTNYLLFYGCF